MKRRDALGGLLALAAVLVSGAALAASVQEQVVAQLRAQGYSGIRIRKTLLGRLRFTAERGDHTREIIINPNTGEILRDFVDTSEGVQLIDRSDGGGSGRGGDDDGDRSGPGGGGDREDDDRSGPGGGGDDREDDDRDGGNSGPGGGGNSGPGGGGDSGGDDSGGDDSGGDDDDAEDD